MYRIYDTVISNQLNESIVKHVLSQSMVEGRVGNRVAPEKKVRYDQTIRDKNITQNIDCQFRNIIDTNIYKFRETYKVGIYHAPSGFYCAHRDNWCDKGHRVWSIVMSLSDPSEYDGGELHFEEVGMKFKLGKNQAIVFDSGILHGVTPVTRGRRMTLISFVFEKRIDRPLLDEFRWKLPLSDPDYVDTWVGSESFLHEDNGSDTLLITMAGMGVAGSRPAFIFKNFLSKWTHVDKLFMRDISCNYYMNVNSLPIKTDKYKYIYILGCSAGGWAAIRFGELCGATRVWAFSPQTELYTEGKQVTPVKAKSLCDQWGPLDICSYISGRCPIEIHYGHMNTKDSYHAQRLQNYSTIELHPWPTGHHTIALWLRDSKRLEGVLQPLKPTNEGQFHLA